MRESIEGSKAVSAKRRWLVMAVVASAVAVVLLFGSQPSVRAADPVPVYSGYSTGTNVFFSLLTSLIPGAGELVNVSAAMSVAASGTSTLGGSNNEMGHAVVPSSLISPATPITSFNSYGRGSGLEVGLAT